MRQEGAMGKSWDFIKKINTKSGLANQDLKPEQILEISPEQFLKLNEDRQLLVRYDGDNPNSYIDINIRYNPDEDFKCFTEASSRHDGTAIFVLDDINRCLKRFLTLGVYDREIGMPSNIFNYQYYYTIGDVVITFEHGDRFATEQKPWMTERTTVMIPFAFDYERREQM